METRLGLPLFQQATPRFLRYAVLLCQLRSGPAFIHLVRVLYLRYQLRPGPSYLGCTTFLLLLLFTVVETVCGPGASCGRSLTAVWNTWLTQISISDFLLSTQTTALQESPTSDGLFIVWYGSDRAGPWGMVVFVMTGAVVDEGDCSGSDGG